jgi:hypothetical protein
VGPFGLVSRTLNGGMFDMAIIVSALSLCIKIGIGASGDCEDCAMSWEGVRLLLGFLDLWRRW